MIDLKKEVSVNQADYEEMWELMEEASRFRKARGACCAKDGDQCEWHQRLWDIANEQRRKKLV